MTVCCRYKTILQGIEAELLLKLQAHLHTLANKAGLEGAAGRLSRLAGVQHLGKGALFIRCTDTQRTLLRTFDLENLGQGFASFVAGASHPRCIAGHPRCNGNMSAPRPCSGYGVWSGKSQPSASPQVASSPFQNSIALGTSKLEMARSGTIFERKMILRWCLPWSGNVGENS